MAKVEVKHTAKDSVFTDLFSIPKYLFELYQAIHPEDSETTIEDLKSVTCRCILAEHPYNDLGFCVGDRLIVLVEAQSTWSPNIVLRLLSYWVQTLNNYFTEHDILLYKNSKVHCPKPELYVIYTGERRNVPEYLTFKDLYFPDEKSIDIDVKVHLLCNHENGDIIYQYITFCKILTAQIKLNGATRKAIEETLCICRDKQILAEYLKQRENEIMDIMTTLFDQDYITKLYGIEQRREGREEGREEGIKSTAFKMHQMGLNISVISEATGLTYDEIENLCKKDQL